MATQHIDQFANFRFRCFICTNMTGKLLEIFQEYHSGSVKSKG